MSPRCQLNGAPMSARCRLDVGGHVPRISLSTVALNWYFFVRFFSRVTCLQGCTSVRNSPVTRMVHVRSYTACRAGEKSAATKQASYWSFRKARVRLTAAILDERSAWRWTCLVSKKSGAPRQSKQRDDGMRNGNISDLQFR